MLIEDDSVVIAGWTLIKRIVLQWTWVISQMGRVYRERIYRPRPVWRRTYRRSLPDLRVASTRTRVAPTDAIAGMEILRGVLSLTQINHVTIDSLVFRLHSNATVILLVTFSIAITTRQYVGNPIDCVHSRDIPEDVLNTYCWIHSTYTVIDAFRKTAGQQVAYPGIENSYSKQSGRAPIKQVKYYQWVAFTLFLQV
ncbi:hypothetical protein ILUMI_24212 [Ignelater luminosus]|uniref:Innexin n=1 Tax=Ignelater luminosus TaxID=2038154 RepID=A0A8K0C7H3_IGNLU|nr:hypothetical protein ILUMI_24212 [Ignelater luminosus]